MHPQAVIAEARPMLVDLLRNIGLYRDDTPLDLSRTLEPFSRWVAEQTIEEADRLWLVSRLGAFICEYLIDHHSAERRIDHNRILMRIPVTNGVTREFDPYAVAFAVTDRNVTLLDFLATLTARIDETE